MQSSRFVAFVVAVLLSCSTPLWSQAVNLARFQDTTASDSGGTSLAAHMTDGVVSQDSRWYSTGAAPHWAQIDLPESFLVGSAHLYLGTDDNTPVVSFSLQYQNGGGGWQNIQSFSGNSATFLNVIFSAPVIANQFRVLINDSSASIREIALFPPNGGAGYPSGTAVNLGLGSQRRATASSVATQNGTKYYAKHAVDGFVSSASRWFAENTTGSHSLTLDFGADESVGSFHVYTGWGGGGYLSAFSIDYWDGSAWQPLPQGTVNHGTMTGNAVSGVTQEFVRIVLPSALITTQVRLQFSAPLGRVREFQVLPAIRNADGSTSFPEGAGVRFADPPATSFTTYQDSWHRLSLRGGHPDLVVDAGGGRLASPEDSTAEVSYQLLYDYALEAYRIINQTNGNCLQVADASTALGAAIEEGAYTAAAHQLWTLVPTIDGYFQIRNVLSGHVLASSVSSGSLAVITQEAFDPGTGQDVDDLKEWKPFKIDDLFKKGHGGWVGSWNSQWGYNWGRDGYIGGTNRFFAPMQWGDYNWDTLHDYYPGWHRHPEAIHLLGFNEPDRPDQSNMSVPSALNLWPRLAAMNMPLLSPACALGGEGWWLAPFMDALDDEGLRCDFVGHHWYADPVPDNFFNYVNYMASVGNSRDVWITEFSCVDWTPPSPGGGTWSEEDCYNFILEVMWRAEGQENLRKYAMFVFTEQNQNGQRYPANPWDLDNARSNFRRSNGDLTPFGKAYAAWTGDDSIRDLKPYILHNRGCASRLRNDGGSLTGETLRTEDGTCQWVLQNAGGGKQYITSLHDGRRLRHVPPSSLDYAPPGTTGPEVEWSVQNEVYNWHNIIHAHSGRYLSLVRTIEANVPSYTFETKTEAEAVGLSSTDWAFVNPYEPVTIDPPPTPAAPVVLAADGAVHVSWASSTDPEHLHHNLYRREAGSETWTLLLSGLTSTSHIDGTAVNGTDYQYAVSDLDSSGIESGLSVGSATAIPAAAEPALVITYVDATRSNLSPAAGGAWNPPLDGANGMDDEWEEKGDSGNNGNVWESGGEGAENAPVIHMTLTGLPPDSVFDLYAYFWTASGQSWNLRAGHPGGPLKIHAGFRLADDPEETPADPLSTDAAVGAFSHPSLNLGTTGGGFHFGNHFTNTPASILLVENDRSLYQASLGHFVSDAAGNLVVAIDDMRPAVSDADRTWFDGLGFRLTVSPPEFSITSITRNGNQMQLAWESFANMSYDIMATGDLAAPFDIPVAAGIPGAGRSTAHEFTLPPPLVGGAKGFFRIVGRVSEAP